MLASAATMSVESSITMIAPEPDMLPAAMQRIKIIRQIQHVDFLLDVLAVGTFFFILNFSPALKTLAEEPPGMTALSFRPSRKPPPKSSLISWPIVALPTSIS